MNKGFSAILLIAIVVAVISSAGYIFYSRKEKAEKLEERNSQIDVSTWKDFSNDFLSFQYPAEWAVRDRVLKNGDVMITVEKEKRKTPLVIFSIMNRSGRDENASYQFSKDTESGKISNERDFKIDGMVSRAYDVARDSEIRTGIFLTTQNYFYGFTYNPANDETLLKILETVKIKLK